MFLIYFIMLFTTNLTYCSQDSNTDDKQKQQVKTTPRLSPTKTIFQIRQEPVRIVHHLQQQNSSNNNFSDIREQAHTLASILATSKKIFYTPRKKFYTLKSPINKKTTTLPSINHNDDLLNHPLQPQPPKPTTLAQNPTELTNSTSTTIFSQTQQKRPAKPIQKQLQLQNIQQSQSLDHRESDSFRTMPPLNLTKSPRENTRLPNIPGLIRSTMSDIQQQRRSGMLHQTPQASHVRVALQVILAKREKEKHDLQQQQQQSANNQQPTAQIILPQIPLPSRKVTAQLNDLPKLRELNDSDSE